MGCETADFKYKFGILEFRGKRTIYPGAVGLYEGRLFIDDDAIEYSNIRMVYDQMFTTDHGICELRECMFNKITELYLDEVEENLARRTPGGLLVDD